MYQQSTPDFERLKQMPIFMEVMRQAPADAAKVETILCAVLERVLESCERAGLTMDETYWLLEVHARAVIGAQIALYLDRMIHPEQREEMKQVLLAAAEAISMLRNDSPPRKNNL
jgi:hypothetical protein